MSVVCISWLSKDLSFSFPHIKKSPTAAVKMLLIQNMFLNTLRMIGAKILRKISGSKGNVTLFLKIICPPSIISDSKFLPCNCRAEYCHLPNLLHGDNLKLYHQILLQNTELKKRVTGHTGVPCNFLISQTLSWRNFSMSCFLLPASCSSLKNLTNMLLVIFLLLHRICAQFQFVSSASYHECS